MGDPRKERQARVLSLPIKNRGLREDIVYCRGGISHRGKWRQRLQARNRDPSDQHPARLRLRNNLKSEVLQLLQRSRGFVLKPELYFNLSVADKLDFFGTRRRILVLQPLNDRGKGRMEF